MTATVKDLAKETGLGLATISSYLNGGNVRDKNRVKIEAAIEKYGYTVNEVARSLKTNRTMSIGVVVPELKSNFFSNIITEMEDILRHHGYSVIVSDCRTNPEHERDAVQFLLGKRVDGLINAPVDYTGAHLQPIIEAGTAVVLIDRKIDGLACDSISVDNIDAMDKAVGHLLENGHRFIGYIGGPESVYTATQRTTGYKAAIEKYGLPFKDSLIVKGDYTIQGGRDAMLNLVRNNPNMTAVITTNDEMTIGGMIAVNELGLHIPEDLSIIGFDDLDFAHACRPGLTIISQPSKEIARKAAEIMLKRLSGEPIDGVWDIKLSTILAKGKSIKKFI